MTRESIQRETVALWLLRAGLAFVFVYAAVSSLLHPADWVGYLPSQLTNHVNADVALKLIAIYQLILSAWLLSGKFGRYAALLAALTLTGILTTNFGTIIITFRDVGLICMALGLAALEK